MQLGLFTPLFHAHGFDELLAMLRQYPEIEALELGCGGWPGSSHIDPVALLGNPAEQARYLERLSDSSLSISALSCHGNPVHPDPAIAGRDRQLLETTIRLAEQLHVKTVITFSGCPGGSPRDTTPNWITTAWPPEFATALEWQWDEVLVPYWQRTERLAADAGVRIALEAHPGFCVYNPETMLRLRAATGPALGVNLDPSHLWWQGIDPAMAVQALASCLFHFHAKDVAISSGRVAVNGLLDTKSYGDIDDRSWSFRTVGWGHGENDWKQIVSALRIAGYDGVISIEHEDAMLSIDEGLRSAVSFLSGIIPRQPPAAPWWT